LNAQIDFPDEDLPEDVAVRALAPLRALVIEIDQALSDVRGERVRDGLRIALIGAPNAGKSSLFNALVQREAAIVTATPGTTRDVIEAPLILGGFKVVLADTAGMRTATDEIEIEGVRRAMAWAEDADLRLWVIEPLVADADCYTAGLAKPNDIIVLTKSDLGYADRDLLVHWPLAVIKTSVVGLGGLDLLTKALKDWASTALGGADFPAVTRIRHRKLLEEARGHLDRALSQTVLRAETMAADVGLAMRALESIAGRMDTETILDRVFSTFCIGK